MRLQTKAKTGAQMAPVRIGSSNRIHRCYDAALQCTGTGVKSF